MVVIAKIMIATDRDRDSLRFDLPVRRSTRTRTVSFDTTHVAKGQGLWLWAERHRFTSAAQRRSAARRGAAARRGSSVARGAAARRRGGAVVRWRGDSVQRRGGVAPWRRRCGAARRLGVSARRGTAARRRGAARRGAARRGATRDAARHDTTRHDNDQQQAVGGGSGSGEAVGRRGSGERWRRLVACGTWGACGFCLFC
jgi:hypothetical protein